MSSFATPSPPSATFDPFSCPSCGDPFTSKIGEGLPVGLSCGHTVCAGCDAAIRRPDKKECPVCYAELKGDGLKNPVLGAFCDESLPESSPATDSDARDGDNEDDSRAVKKPRSLLDPAVVACSAHSDVPAAIYCSEHYAALCEECEAVHDNCERVVLESAGWLIRSKSGLFRAVSHAATSASTKTETLKKKLHQNCDAAVEKVVNTVTELKAKLDELCAAKVAEIRKLTADRLKQLDATHDELLVRASQLNAGAALCESAAEKSPADAVGVLSAIRAFDKLACQRVVDGRKLAEIRFAGNVQDAATAACDALSSLLRIRSTEEHVTAEDASEAVAALADILQLQDTTRLSRVMDVMDDFIEEPTVQAAGCEALRSILIDFGSPYRVDFGEFAAQGAPNALFAAMSAHLSDNEVQKTACLALNSYDTVDDLDITIALPTLMAVFDAHAENDYFFGYIGSTCSGYFRGFRWVPGYKELMLAYNGEAHLHKMSKRGDMGFLKREIQSWNKTDEKPLGSSEDDFESFGESVDDLS